MYTAPAKNEPTTESQPSPGKKKKPVDFSFTSAQAGATPATGFAFGAPAASGSSAFTASAVAFAFGAPASAASAAAASSSGLGFGSTASSGSSAATKSAGIGFGAAAPAPTGSSAPATSGFSFAPGSSPAGGAPASSAEPLSGGSLFAAKGSSAAASSLFAAPSTSGTNTTGKATSSAGSLFTSGAPASSGKPPAPISSGFSLGAPASSPNAASAASAAAASSSGAVVASSAGGFSSLFGGSGANVVATASAPSLQVSTPLTVPSDIKDLSLDEVVNKWTDEVADLAVQFEKAAQVVTKWDRAIVANEDKIRALHRDAQGLQIAHKELTENLDVIASQQTELHKLLDALELDVEKKIGSNSLNRTVHARGFGTAKVQGDVEREAMHRLSIELIEELDTMALKIRDLVVELNKGSDTSIEENAGDTVSQIISVLNAHLDSLQYLDETSNALNKKVTDVQRACDVAVRETERIYGQRTGLY